MIYLLYRRMIPEFLRLPGYSDKFVRIVDNQLLVQSRDEALGVAFQEGSKVVGGVMVYHENVRENGQELKGLICVN